VFDVIRSLENCQVFLMSRSGDSLRDSSASRAIGFWERVRISVAVVVRHIESIKVFR